MNLSRQIDPVFKHLGPMLNAITGRPVIVEIGMHWGESTCLLQTFCRRPPVYFGFEPDTRNLRVLRLAGYDPRAMAISDKNEYAVLRMSGGETPGCPGRIHTDSSSLKIPTKHLQTHPWCTFSEEERVVCRTLDSVMDDENQSGADLIWADVQGAQLEVIAGAQRTLRWTRYLYIEVHPEPMYDGEPTFEQLCAALPDWEVVERYPADVLFRNRRLTK